MGPGEALGLFKDFGPMGLFVGFLIWDKLRLDGKWRKIEEARLVQRKEQDERRAKIDEARIETDQQLVLTLQSLTFEVRSKS